jgi:hypothetical protein
MPTNWRAVAAFQSLLSLGTVWMVYRLAKEAYSDWVGVLAGACAMLYADVEQIDKAAKLAAVALAQGLDQGWICPRSQGDASFLMRPTV